MRPSRRGFTLIELTVVIVIVALLAMLAIPRFASSRGRAVTATLRADLRNVAVAEEAHFYQHSVYTTDLPALSVGVSPGVTLAVVTADSSGWAATADHPLGRHRRCALFYGAPTSRPAPAVVEGQIACE